MKVLAIAAHPDDEILGCGATLAKHVLAGDDVSVMWMTNGVGSRFTQNLDGYSEECAKRRDACAQAMREIGVTQSLPGPYADNAMDAAGPRFLDVVQWIEAAVKEQLPSPDIIYTHYAHDLNIDHRVTHEAVKTAFRPVPGSSVKAIRCFEIHSSTEWNFGDKPFEPNYFVNVHGEPIERKIKALNAYDAEMRAWPHARSYMSAISRHAFRGSTVGYEAAEAFVTLWERRE